MKKELVIIGLIELVLGIEWIIVASLRYIDSTATTGLPHDLLMASAAFAGLSLILASLLALKRQKPTPNIGWLIILGLAAGLVLNVNFYLNSDGLTPVSHSTNLIMGGAEAVLAAYYLLGVSGSRRLKKLLG